MFELLSSDELLVKLVQVALLLLLPLLSGRPARAETNDADVAAIAPSPLDRAAFQTELAKLREMVERQTYRGHGFTKREGHRGEYEVAVNLDPFFRQLEKTIARAYTPDEISQVLRVHLSSPSLVAHKRTENKRFGLFHEEEVTWQHDFGPEYNARLAAIFDGVKARFEAGHPSRQQIDDFELYRKPLGSASAEYRKVAPEEFKIVVPALVSQVPKNPAEQAFSTALANLRKMVQNKTYEANGATKYDKHGFDIEGERAIDLNIYFEKLERTLALARHANEIADVLDLDIGSRNLVARKWFQSRWGKSGDSFVHDFGPEYRARLAAVLDGVQERFEAASPDEAARERFQKLRASLGPADAEYREVAPETFHLVAPAAKSEVAEIRDPQEDAFQSALADLRTMLKKQSFRRNGATKYDEHGFDIEGEQAIDLDAYFKKLERVISLARGAKEIGQALSLDLDAEKLVAQKWFQSRWGKSGITYSHDYAPEYRARLRAVLDGVQDRFEASNPDETLRQEFQKLRAPLGSATAAYEKVPAGTFTLLPQRVAAANDCGPELAHLSQ